MKKKIIVIFNLKFLNLKNAHLYIKKTFKIKY